MFESMDTPYGGARAATALVGAALSAFAIWRMLAPKPPPPEPVAAQVVAVKGEVIAARLQGGVAVEPDAPAAVGRVVREEDQFKIARDGLCRIQTADGSLVQLDAGDQSRGFLLVDRLTPGGGELGIALREGRVMIRARPSLEWTVEADSRGGGGSNSARASGKGATAIVVYAKGADALNVAVKEGQASVSPSLTTTSSIPVPAGHRVKVTAAFGDRPEVVPVDASDLDDLAGLDRPAGR